MPDLQLPLINTTRNIDDSDSDSSSSSASAPASDVEENEPEGKKKLRPIMCATLNQERQDPIPSQMQKDDARTSSALAGPCHSSAKQMTVTGKDVAPGKMASGSRNPSQYAPSFIMPYLSVYATNQGVCDESNVSQTVKHSAVANGTDI